MAVTFIQPAELARRLGETDVVVVDTRFALDDDDRGERDYEQAHVPGAIYLHWYRDLSDPDDPIRGQLAPAQTFAAAIGGAGISNATRVVAYDDGALFLAARLAWSLATYGHEQVEILAGGFPHWLATGQATESGRVSREPAAFVPGAARPIRLDFGDVRAAIGSGVPIVDCRMDATWNAAGEHIPGARRLPAPSLLGTDGAPRGAAELVELARAAGLRQDEPGILYCGGGVSAALAFTALEAVGFSRLAVYDGSWSEWSADPSTPREPHSPAGT